MDNESPTWCMIDKLGNVVSVDVAAEVRECGGDELFKDDTTVTCPFYRYRLGKGRPSVRTIRRECLYCMSGSSNAVEDCRSILCALWPYRQGHNPERKGQGGPGA